MKSQKFAKLFGVAPERPPPKTKKYKKYRESDADGQQLSWLSIPDDGRDVVGMLPAETLATLPVGVMERLPPDRLESLPPEHLARLSVDVLRTLTPTALSRLPVSALAKLPSDVLERLPVTTLEQLPPEIRARLYPIAQATTMREQEPEDGSQRDWGDMPLRSYSVLRSPQSSRPSPHEHPRFPPSQLPPSQPTAQPADPFANFGAVWNQDTDGPDRQSARNRRSDQWLRKSQSPARSLSTSDIPFREPEARDGSQDHPTGPLGPPQQPGMGGAIRRMMTERRKSHSGRNGEPRDSLPLLRDATSARSGRLQRLDEEGGNDLELGVTHEEIRSLRHERQNLGRENKALLDENMGLSQMVDARARQVDDLQMALQRRQEAFAAREAQLQQEKAMESGKHQQDITALKTQHMQALDGLKSMHETQLRELEAEVSSYKQNAEGQKKDSDGLQKQRDVYEQELNRLRRYVEELETRHAAEVQELQLQRKDELHEVTSMWGAKFEERQNQHNNELGNLKNGYATQLHQQNVMHQKAQSEKEESAVAMAKASAAHKAELERQQKEFDNRMVRLASENKKLQQSEAAKHSTDLKQVEETYKRNMEKERAQFADHLQAERNRLDILLRQERDEHQRVLGMMRSEPGDHIRQVPDSDLKTMFRELGLAIQVVTEPFNLGTVRVPDDGRLDPTKFLEREGKNMVRCLLRSVVWAKVLDGFFSAPCGFGAFGSGGGKKMLVDLYQAWLRLFSQRSSKGEYVVAEDPDFERFRRDKEANRWRSATFHSVLTTLKPKDGRKPSGGETKQSLVTPFEINQAKVTEDILSVLREVTVGGQLHEEIEEEVKRLASMAGELSLEIGVHRSFLGLEVPARGEVVEIGPQFVDWVDGDAARGRQQMVDLIVCPHFFRVGDGRNDLSTVKSIHPGEIYAVPYEEGSAEPV